MQTESRSAQEGKKGFGRKFARFLANGGFLLFLILGVAIFILVNQLARG